VGAINNTMVVIGGEEKEKKEPSVKYDDTEGVYYHLSAKDPTITYTVFPLREWDCTCPDHRNRKRDCKHIKRCKIIHELKTKIENMAIPPKPLKQQ
jgi:hypothetical protein